MKTNAICVGGRADGFKVPFGQSEFLQIPFMCGMGFCTVTYRRTDRTQDGLVVLELFKENHRDSEESLVTIGPGLEHRVCQEFAKTEPGKEWIEAHQDRSCDD